MLFGKIGKENDMLKLDIQMFARQKLVIETDLDKKGFESLPENFIGMNLFFNIFKFFYFNS
jgi:hypothetical protein